MRKTSGNCSENTSNSPGEQFFWQLIPLGKGKCMKKLLPIGFTIAVMILTGCGIQQTVPNETPQQVKWTSLPAKERQDIIKVSDSYGDAHPQVIKIVKTLTDNNGQHMYLVHLGGHFHRGKHDYTHLEFSMLANGSETWATNLN
jgi:hypothetical protein